MEVVSDVLRHSADPPLAATCTPFDCLICQFTLMLYHLVQRDAGNGSQLFDSQDYVTESH